ncbi:MAG: DUF599 domain-containing protein [Gammaproteobacteria bacterium]|nr:DUF599 domain-containing protein [Gammaproteobacteria bacterium]
MESINTDMIAILSEQGWNLAALLWFVISVRGYQAYAIKASRRKDSLAGVLHAYRQRWMIRMIGRDMRMADIGAVANLERYVTLFASSSLLVLAGLVTLVGYTDDVVHIGKGIPFLPPQSALEWQFKLFFLILLFVYAFFKFTWSLRQYGFATVMISSAPVVHGDIANNKDLMDHVNRSAKVLSMAGNNFNFGLRAYYYSLAVLTWSIHPVAFMITTTAVVYILYSREFNSSSLAELKGSNDSKNRKTLVDYHLI